jgi:hypothetical protein
MTHPATSRLDVLATVHVPRSWDGYIDLCKDCRVPWPCPVAELLPVARAAVEFIAADAQSSTYLYDDARAYQKRQARKALAAAVDTLGEK